MLIVPPGLNKDFYIFKDHYEVAMEENKPILILGDTGVGKTLFYKFYESLFFSDKKNAGKPIVMANCAHFGNQQSDPNIAHTELFGIEKGVITGIVERNGLIAQANKGVLFLEEIGELPIAVQAMLLTFIEDKIYRKFGSNKSESADCHIVAATNNEDALREDFKNRFFPFHVPAVYKRRNDVLYYMYAKWPELVASLTRHEVLMLLSYNWPGNVRKIERIALLLKRHKKGLHRYRLRIPENAGEVLGKHLENAYTALRASNLADWGGSSAHKDINLSRELEKKGADIEYLNSLLNEYGIGFEQDINPDNCPFHTIETNKPKFNLAIEKTKENDLEIRIYEPYDPFENAYEGYQIYCRLFLQYYQDDKNVLKDLTECFPVSAPGQEIYKNRSKFNKLMRVIFEFLSGVKLDKSFQFPTGFSELEKTLDQYSEMYPSNEFFSSATSYCTKQKKINGEAINQILTLSKQELLSTYYENLLKLTQGNISAASRKAKLSNSTFRDELEKYGLRN